MLEATNLHLEHSESSAVGSALRSGRRGREFESPLSDIKRVRGGLTVHLELFLLENTPSFIAHIINIKAAPSMDAAFVLEIMC